MRVLIITQDEPLFLPGAIDGLLSNMPDFATVVGCVVLPVSPFGKRAGFVSRAWAVARIFGWRYFGHYAIRFAAAKLRPWRGLLGVLKRHGVPVVQLQGSINSPPSVATLAAQDADLFISIAGNQLFKRVVFELPRLGCLNLHTALLPKYRGLMPTFWVLKNNEAETGVSVFLVDEGIDAGPIVVQKRVTIGSMSQDELIRHTKHIGMQAILEAIATIHRGSYALIDNPQDEMTYFGFPTRDDVRAFRASGKRFY